MHPIIENTKKLAESFGIKHEIIDINFYEDDEFIKNDEKRCYACRSLMYSEIEKAAEKNGFDFICDGNNISDLVVDRPGILVTYEKDFKTPFIEAKLDSKEIHKYLNSKDIPYSRSTTCIATRIKTNTEITKERIDRICDCEDYIYKNTNCKTVKVRDHGEVCIVEVDNTNEIMKNTFDISRRLKQNGFKKVALNLSQLRDDEFIVIEYGNGSFSYNLPFSINIEDTMAKLDNVASYSKDRIDMDNFSIFEDGLIVGRKFDSYRDALYAFMDILPKIRRNI